MYMYMYVCMCSAAFCLLFCLINRLWCVERVLNYQLYALVWLAWGRTKCEGRPVAYRVAPSPGFPYDKQDIIDIGI